MLINVHVKKLYMYSAVLYINISLNVINVCIFDKLF